MTLVVMMAVSISSFSVMAQNAQDAPAQRRAKQRPTPEQMMDRHVKMMEKKLVMDDATAAKFTPLYKEYLQAMKDCRPAVNKDTKKIRDDRCRNRKSYSGQIRCKTESIGCAEKVFQEVQGSAKCKTIAESVSAAMYGWKDET